MRTESLVLKGICRNRPTPRRSISSMVRFPKFDLQAKAAAGARFKVIVAAVSAAVGEVRRAADGTAVTTNTAGW